MKKPLAPQVLQAIIRLYEPSEEREGRLSLRWVQELLSTAGIVVADPASDANDLLEQGFSEANKDPKAIERLLLTVVDPMRFINYAQDRDYKISDLNEVLVANGLQIHYRLMDTWIGRVTPALSTEESCRAYARLRAYLVGGLVAAIIASVTVWLRLSHPAFFENPFGWPLVIILAIAGYLGAGGVTSAIALGLVVSAIWDGIKSLGGWLLRR